MCIEISRARELKTKIAVSPFQAIFDSLTNLASAVCETNYATISVMDSYNHLFISTVGINCLKEVPINDSLCKNAIINTLLEIEDAQADERYWDNPYVKGELSIRFYAGVPISMPLGEQMGTVCVFDQFPKLLNNYQKQALIGISKTVQKTIVAQEFVLKQNLFNK